MNKLAYTVLYIEDNDALRKNIVEYLNYEFTNVLEASDGLIAYNLFNENKPDFIITDIHLPRMHGMELIRKIRDIDKNIPIIAMSAYSEREKLLSAIKYNLMDYLIKPVSREALSGAIAKTVEKLQEKVLSK